MSHLVFGVGLNDYKGMPKPENYDKFYRMWVNMLKRCYSSSYHKRKPSYIGCTVDPDWLVLSNFISWVSFQEWEDKQLDKDILHPGNKIYSKDFCCFVDKRINSFVTERQADRGDYPIGVNFHKVTGKFVAQVNTGIGYQTHLGTFDTPELAHQAWLQAKYELAVELSKNLPKHIGEALVKRYRVNKELQ